MAFLTCYISGGCPWVGLYLQNVKDGIGILVGVRILFTFSARKSSVTFGSSTWI